MEAEGSGGKTDAGDDKEAAGEGGAAAAAAACLPHVTWWAWRRPIG